MWLFFNIAQILIIVITTSLTLVLALPLALIGLPKASYWLGRNFWGPFLVFMAGGKVTVSGRENVNKEKPYIYSANHMSNFDIPILFAITPVNLHFIAKKELKKVPFFGWCIAAMGMIFIDRKNKKKAIESMKNAGKLIKNGKNVITFPEGKRSRSGNIEMFRKGTFVIANEANIDVIPVAIKGSNILHKPGGFQFRPGKVHVKFGEPIKASSFKDKSPEEFANYTKQAVEKLYESM